MLGFVSPSSSSSSSSSSHRHDDARGLSANPKFTCKYNHSPMLDHDYGVSHLSRNSQQETQYVVWGISSLSLYSAQLTEPEAQSVCTGSQCQVADPRQSYAWPCSDTSGRGKCRERLIDDYVTDGVQECLGVQLDKAKDVWARADKSGCIAAHRSAHGRVNGSDDYDGSATGCDGLGSTCTHNASRDALCKENSGLESIVFNSSRSSRALSVVDEDRPWDVPPHGPTNCAIPCVSSSSTLSSLSIEKSDFPNGSLSALDIEVESPYNGREADHADNNSAPASSPRKGLSRFYSGKSRSFSCLGDVMSLKEIVKPDNPYARKRKQNSVGSGLDRPPRLPPLLKGVGSISKKSLHNSGKTKVALNVALSSMIMNEEEVSVQESEASLPRKQTKPGTYRSYSLSDLQGVCGHHESQYRAS